MAKQLYNLKTVNNYVDALLKNEYGDFVKTSIPEDAAKDIIDKGNIVLSDKFDYQICIDKTWYFVGEVFNISNQSNADNSDLEDNSINNINININPKNTQKGKLLK